MIATVDMFVFPDRWMKVDDMKKKDFKEALKMLTRERDTLQRKLDAIKRLAAEIVEELVDV